MLNRWKKKVTIFLLVIFCLNNSTIVFANANTNFDFLQTAGYEQSFIYEENGHNFECFFKETSNGFDGIVYKLENGEKIFYDQFCITSDNNGNVWIDGVLFVEVEQENIEGEIMPLELYPYQYHHGRVNHSSGMTIASVALGIYTAIAKVNPAISVAVTVFTPIATVIVEDKLSSTYYQVRSQLETFPTNVPPEYSGAVTKIDYQYTLYRSTDLTSQNQIGSTVYDVYYGMPY